MSSDAFTPSEVLSTDFTLFEATPGMRFVFLPDAPRFTIAAATKDICRHVGRSKEQLVGKGIFEAFPSNPADPADTGERDLRTSLVHVLQHKEAHQLPTQRYDVKEEDGRFIKRYWRVSNTPVFGPDGEVAYIIHTSENITEQVEASEVKEQMTGIEQAHHLFLQAPIVIGIVRGKDHVVELANEEALMFWNKTDDVVGKPLLEAIPELRGQDVYQKIDEVFHTGRLYQGTEVPVTSIKDGKAVVSYFDLYYKPYYDEGSSTVNGVFTISNDVTEKVLAQKKVAESERNLRNTILQSPVAMCILRGPAFLVEIANDHMYELWGKRKEELLNKPIFEGLPEVKDQGYEALLNGVFTTGERFTAQGIPVTLPRSTGVETVYINLLYEPFREADSTISGVIAVATDVTQQVLAQRRLEESEAVLQKRVAERTAELEQQKCFIESVLKASFNGIYALKAVRNAEGMIMDFEYLFANSTIAKLLGREAEAIIGDSMLELLPENRTNGFFDIFCRVLQTGERYQDETHFVAQNIDSWYNYVIVPVDGETVVVSIEDITEIKQTTLHIEEQRNLLENILKNSSNGISVSHMLRNESGKVTDALTILANDAAVHYVGLPKDIYLSKKATEIEPNIVATPYFQQCIKTLETGEPFMMQYLVESTSRWLELSVSRLDKDRIIHIFTDVTSIKEAQLQLERYVEDLKRSNQNLEQFAYAASHDLKEPMRKIELFSDRLKDRLRDKLTQEDKGFFDRILHATHRMNTLIDDLLMYSHVSSGAVRDEMVDLNQKVKRVLEDLEVEVEENKAIISVDPLPTIKGHRRQLQQLFQNLISNAIKYSRPGVPPQVRISARMVKGNDPTISNAQVNSEKHYHLIEVSDNGIGFDQQDAERIFHVFTRLHGNAEYKGTGVGLSIVRKVVENHGGYIWAEGKEGEGATFKVLLPAEYVLPLGVNHFGEVQ